MKFKKLAITVPPMTENPCEAELLSVESVGGDGNIPEPQTMGVVDRSNFVPKECSR
jgi:hypothetical protein